MTGYANDKPVRRDEPHHYVIHYEWCPVCGAERVERTRMAGPRPRDPDPTIEYHLTHVNEERYDYCDG